MDAHEKKMKQEEMLEATLNEDVARQYLVEYGRAGAEAHIMKTFGVSSAVVRDYFTNHNIHQTKEVSQQRRIATNMKKYGAGTKPSKPVIDKDLLQRYYVDEMIDIPDIVPLFDNKYTAWQITDALSSYGIKRPAKGNPHRKRTPESIEKFKQTCLEKYGAENPHQSEAVKEKTQKTCMERYGIAEISKAESVQQKRKATTMKHYGVENPFMSSEIQQKARDVQIEKYGNIYTKTDGFAQKVRDTKQARYGDPDYHNVEQARQTRLNKRNARISETMEKAKQYGDGDDGYIAFVFNWCREVDFPYPAYNEDVVQKSLRTLKNYSPDKYKTSSRVGMKIVDAFHPSIWHANKKGRLSPYSAWQNDDLLKRCIKNRIIYKGHDLDRSKVLGGFSTAGIAPKVSVFTPYFAKYIIHKYLNDFDTVFDPCAGFSGRLLGAVSLGKGYSGQDINPTTVKESNDLINHFGFDNVNVSCVDLLKDSGKYDCLFTCPPYSDKESWGMKCENKTCDEWIDECLGRYDCKRYVFVVDETEKYKDNITENMNTTSHFGTSTDRIVVIDR